MKKLGEYFFFGLVCIGFFVVLPGALLLLVGAGLYNAWISAGPWLFFWIGVAIVSVALITGVGFFVTVLDNKKSAEISDEQGQ